MSDTTEKKDTLLPHGAHNGGLSNPDVDHLDTKDFWKACTEHRLIVQQCGNCDRHRFPPQPICFNCQSLEFEWREKSQEGTVYSYAVATHPVHPSLIDRLPYVIILVEIDEADGERIMGNYLGDVAELEIGQRVRITWEDVEPGLTLPQWDKV